MNLPAPESEYAHQMSQKTAVPVETEPQTMTADDTEPQTMTAEETESQTMTAADCLSSSGHCDPRLLVLVLYVYPVL